MRWVIALTLAVVAAAVVPALATAPMTITASNYKFSPPSVTIDVGDTVTFTNEGGTHNVVVDDGSGSYPTAPSSTWPSGQQRTFTAAGTYTFHCGQHGYSMTGSIQAGAPAPTPTPSPSPSPSPGPSPEPVAPPPLVRDVRLARSTFCVRHCRHPGVALKLELTRAARGRYKLVLRIGAEPAQTLRFRVS